MCTYAIRTTIVQSTLATYSCYFELFMSRFTVSLGRVIGSMPFLKQLLKKMSAKLVDMMHLQRNKSQLFFSLKRIGICNSSYFVAATESSRVTVK